MAMVRSSIFVLSIIGSFIFSLSINPSLELDDIGFARNHLKAFGYLPRDYIPVEDAHDEALVSALKKYQTFFGLNVTGIIDPDTMKDMTDPRCGIPDFWPTDHMHSITPQYTLFPGRPTWPPSKRSLEYGFSTPLLLPVSTMRGLVENAFEQWSSYSKFTFSYGETDNLDLYIGFYEGAHGDDRPFDGPGGVLAHAFRPTSGLFHYDAEESWSTNPNATQHDLESVALHEIGHLLGIAHSSDGIAVMFPRFRKGDLKRVLRSDDISAIRALYPDG